MKQIESDGLLHGSRRRLGPGRIRRDSDIAPLPKILHVPFLADEEGRKAAGNRSIQCPFHTCAHFLGRCRVAHVIGHVLHHGDRMSGLSIDGRDDLTDILRIVGFPGHR